MDEPTHGATPEQIEAAAERMHNAARTGDPERSRPGYEWRAMQEHVRDYYRGEAAHWARYFYPPPAGIETGETR